MQNSTTLARPYAKAIFEFALAMNELGQWSEILQRLATAVLNDQAMQFLMNPEVTAVQQIQMLMVLFAKEDPKKTTAVENFVSLLTYNKRLPLIPDIKVLFEAQRAEQEKTLEVKVNSFSELSKEQQAELTRSLSQRLQRQVTLDIGIDKSLLGGAVIHAGDLIIDGSVRGKLNKLRTELAA